MSSGFFVSYVILWIIVIIQLIGLLCLFHYQGKAIISALSQNQSHGPKIGSRISASGLTSISGASVKFAESGEAAKAVMFASTTCTSCEGALTAVGKLRNIAGSPSITVVCRGDAEQVDVVTKLRGLNPELVVADPDGRITRDWKVVSVPFVVLLDGHGVVVAAGNPSNGGRLKEILSMVQAHPVNGLRMDSQPTLASR